VSGESVGGSLDALLSRVWRDQGRDGFLLGDPSAGDTEVHRDRDPESQVRFRFRWLPHREVRADVAELEARGILDPNRDESGLFRDPRDTAGRFCFLCAANIRECNPKEELIPVRLAGTEYYAGANFAWISNEHFTVMAADHVDQRFSDHTLHAMLDLHAQTNGTFRVIYNGAYAGATIPWHLHYQVTSEPFPVEELDAGHDDRYPTAVRRFAAGDGTDAALAYAADWTGRNPDHHRVNVLVAGERPAPTIFVFARDTRKSHAAAKGLMGGFEVCGDLVFSEAHTRPLFERADAILARSLLGEIRPDGV
jgi:hypothetical protein